MPKKKQTYPAKTTLNLNQRDIPEGYYRRLTLYVVLAAVLIAAFAHFAVAGRITAAYRAEAEAEAMQMKYQALVKSNAVYPEILNEYEKYFTNPDTEMTYADVMDVLSLVDSHLLPSAGMQSLALSDNVLSIILSGISLDQASAIVTTVSGNEIVASAYVSSIDTSSQEVSLVSMTITLQGREGSVQ